MLPVPVPVAVQVLQACARSALNGNARCRRSQVSALVMVTSAAGKQDRTCIRADRNPFVRVDANQTQRKSQIRTGRR
jgi:hypothetical protein